MHPIEHIIDEPSAGQRLDRYLASMHPERSRSDIQRDIHADRVTVDGAVETHPSRRLKTGESVVWNASSVQTLVPRQVPLAILHEDPHLVVIDKPVGLVVHPGAGTTDPTLVEALLATRELPPSDAPVRPGIVHRLDKETSGILVVAKTPAAMTSLKRQFAERHVSKTYLAVTEGAIDEDEALIEAPIGRDPSYPRRMAIQSTGRESQTEFRVLSRMKDRTLLLVSPKTGRTHQIRVHLRYIKHPVLGDRVYGRSTADSRLMLHAWRIAFRHPHTKEVVRFEAPVPKVFPEYDYDALAWRIFDHAETA